MTEKRLKPKQKMKKMKTCEVFTKFLELLSHAFRDNFKNIQGVRDSVYITTRFSKDMIFEHMAKITNTETGGIYQVRLTCSYVEFNYFGTVSPLISCHLHLFHRFTFTFSVFAERR